MLQLSYYNRQHLWYCMCVCFFFVVFFTMIFTPVKGPRATRGRKLQSKRYRLWGYVGKIIVNLRLEQVKWLRKHPLGNQSHRAAVCGKKLLESNLHLTNGIRWEWSLFTTMCMAWQILAVNVIHLSTFHGNKDRAARGLHV